MNNKKNKDVHQISIKKRRPATDVEAFASKIISYNVRQAVGDGPDNFDLGIHYTINGFDCIFPRNDDIKPHFADKFYRRWAKYYSKNNCYDIGWAPEYRKQLFKYYHTYDLFGLYGDDPIFAFKPKSHGKKYLKDLCDWISSFGEDASHHFLRSHRIRKQYSINWDGDDNIKEIIIENQISILALYEEYRKLSIFAFKRKSKILKKVNCYLNFARWAIYNKFIDLEIDTPNNTLLYINQIIEELSGEISSLKSYKKEFSVTALSERKKISNELKQEQKDLKFYINARDYIIKITPEFNKYCSKVHQEFELAANKIGVITTAKLSNTM